MAMRFHGNVRGEVRVNFLALLPSKPRIFRCGALYLFRICCANVRLNFRLAHQNRTTAIASDFRVDGAKSPEILQKEGVLGSDIAAEIANR